MKLGHAGICGRTGRTDALWGMWGGGDPLPLLWALCHSGFQVVLCEYRHIT